LAVSTANQSVFIYSLPYLQTANQIVLPLKPAVICKLSDGDMFFNDEFLLQSSRVAWLHNKNFGSLLAAGFINGLVAVWNINTMQDDHTVVLYPEHVMQPHQEPITSLDFKATTLPECLLLTSSLDRKVKVFSFDSIRFQELSNYYATSRVLCAEWWLHWPAYIVGFDDCFTYTSLFQRQPMEFGSRNTQLLVLNSSITDLSINHWSNSTMCAMDSGDVIGCNPPQMLNNYTKDKWSHYNFSIYSSTNFSRITNSNGTVDIGVIFCDFKVSFAKKKYFKDFKRFCLYRKIQNSRRNFVALPPNASMNFRSIKSASIAI
jgi:hypothetical protein